MKGGKTRDSGKRTWQHQEKTLNCHTTCSSFLICTTQHYIYSHIHQNLYQNYKRQFVSSIQYIMPSPAYLLYTVVFILFLHHKYIYTEDYLYIHALIGYAIRFTISKVSSRARAHPTRGEDEVSPSSEDDDNPSIDKARPPLLSREGLWKDEACSRTATAALNLGGHM